MADTPVRRGPGRPRKVVAEPAKAKVPASEPAEAPKAEEPPVEKAQPADPRDPRIGQEVHPLATRIGFDDGGEYECADGFITKRVD